jgi:rubrerythrin
MEFKSLDEIIDYAIGKEIEAQEFYASLAEKETHPSGTKQMFLDFVNEEKKHERMLKDIKSGKIKSDGGDGYRFKWVEDIQRADFVEEPEYRPGLPYNEVLLVAIKQEEKALKMYRELYRQARSDDERVIYKILRQEEAKHKLTLEIMYDDYMYEMGD